IPDRALRLIVTSSPEDSAAGVFIDEFFSPLPNIANHVHYTERTGSFRMCVDRIRPTHIAGLVRYRHSGGVPLVAPRIEALVTALRGVLPFPLMRQSLPGPIRIRSRIVLGNPRHRSVLPSAGIRAIFPIAQKIQIVLWMIMRCIQELLELGVRDQI